MTDREARTLSLHEVWETFTKADKYIRDGHLSNMIGGEWFDMPTLREMLRTVLLERCQFEHAITISDGGIFYRMGDLYNCTPSIAKDHGSAWLFMAWEIEQMALQGGAGV